MKSVLSSEVITKFPSYIRGVVVGNQINNNGENKHLMELLRKVEDERVLDVSLQDIKNHPRIANWRQAYADFGSNPNKFYSSIESLCRRARRGDQLPYINTTVALFNYFSLKHIVPSGGDDLDYVDGDLRLVIAKGDELFTPFNTTTVENPSPGEVIYVTNSIVMCRRWNWRQGDQTKLTPLTKNIAVNIDFLPPLSMSDAKNMTSELADLLHEFCGGEVRYFLLCDELTEAEV